MSVGRLILAAAAMVLGACAEERRPTVAPTKPAEPSQPAEPSRPAEPSKPATPALDPVAVLAKFECNRCHQGAGLAAPAPAKACVGCHVDIRAGAFAADAEDLAQWKKNLRSLNHAPRLDGVRRYRRAWVAAFVRNPHDLRPALPATMPRLRMTEAEAEAIAAQLVPAEAPDATFTDAEREEGRALYARLACSTCHAFVRSADHQADSPGLVLAPHLRHTRDRFQSGALAAYLHAPDENMPSFGLTEAQARALAAYVMTEPLPPPIVAIPPARLPVLERQVRWAEVERRVFKKVCWHCHAQPDFAMGDGGPGNSGGFGFAPRGLDLSTATGAMSGAIGDDGERRSIFQPVSGGPYDGVPRIVAHLLARMREQAGDLDAELFGMPLGFPALSAEEIQLVESWISQGRPL